MDAERFRELVLARSWGMCEGCGRFGLSLAAHHRQARGIGGVHGPAGERANDVRNGLALCSTCHDETEHAETWELTETIGWRIPHHVDNPLVVPALIHTVNGHAWWQLTEQSGYRWVDWDVTQRLSYGISGAP